MCGRYHLNSSLGQILDHYGLSAAAVDAGSIPGGEIFPGAHPCVVVGDSATRMCQPMFWGYQPFHSKGRRRQPINARAETLFTSNYWQSSARARRCLIPLNAWDEWQSQDDRTKQRWRIIPQLDAALFSLGGVYTCFRTEDEASTTGFAVVTQPASAALATIHHRQPLIVMPDDYDAWLNPQTPQSSAQRMIRKQGVNYRVQRV